MAKTERVGGRQPATPDTARGKKILAHIQAQGLTLSGAARKARLSFKAVHSAIHDDPAKLTVRTVQALCRRLGLPLSMVAPQLASLPAA